MDDLLSEIQGILDEEMLLFKNTVITRLIPLLRSANLQLKVDINPTLTPVQKPEVRYAVCKSDGTFLAGPFLTMQEALDFEPTEEVTYCFVWELFPNKHDKMLYCWHCHFREWEKLF